NTGRVGLGVAAPKYLLEIANNESSLNVSGNLYVNSTNVGIGTMTPVDTLDVQSISIPILGVAQRTASFGAGTIYSKIDMGLLYTTAEAFYPLGEIQAINENTAASAGTLSFLTRRAHTLTEAMRINSTGNVAIGNSLNVSSNLYVNSLNVGIGTSTPTHTLDVRGAGNFSSTVWINNATDLSKLIINDSNANLTNLLVGGANQYNSLLALNSGSVGIWDKVGTLTISSDTAETVFMTFYGGNGYNSLNTQNAYVTLFGRMGASAEPNGFCSSWFATRYGENSGFITDIVILSNLEGCSATSYDIYIKTGTFIGQSTYKIEGVSGAKWLHNATFNVTTNPGAATNTTVYLVPFEHVIQNNVWINGTTVAIGRSTPTSSGYKLEVANSAKALNVSGMLYVNSTNIDIATDKGVYALNVKGTGNFSGDVYINNVNATTWLYNQTAVTKTYANGIVNGNATYIYTNWTNTNTNILNNNTARNTASFSNWTALGTNINSNISSMISTNNTYWYNQSIDYSFNWTGNATAIWTRSGIAQVGIGTLTPTAKLDVNQTGLGGTITGINVSSINNGGTPTTYGLHVLANATSPSSTPTVYGGKFIAWGYSGVGSNTKSYGIFSNSTADGVAGSLSYGGYFESKGIAGASTAYGIYATASG
ncbi:MAG: hypothetical protein AABX48_00765, partial [Nanoarchaeota archaeon]